MAVIFCYFKVQVAAMCFFSLFGCSLKSSSIVAKCPLASFSFQTINFLTFPNFSLCFHSDKVGSDSFFSPSGSGFNGFPPWHLYCLALCPRHTEAFSFWNISPSPSPLFSFDRLPLCLHRRTHGKCMLTCHMLTYSLVGEWQYFRVGLLIELPLTWSVETLHNRQTLQNFQCVKIAGWAWERQGHSVECNSMTEPVWTLHRQHIPEVRQWEAHSVLSVMRPAYPADLPGLPCCPETRPTQHSPAEISWNEHKVLNPDCMLWTELCEIHCSLP